MRFFRNCKTAPETDRCLRTPLLSNLTEVQHVIDRWQVRGAVRLGGVCSLHGLSTAACLPHIMIANYFNPPRTASTAAVLLSPVLPNPFPWPPTSCQDYFVFGFSRNILARAISQYRYLTHFMPGCPPVPWKQFCADPFVLGDVCRRAQETGSPCCNQSPQPQNAHVLPQSHFFTTATNEWVSCSGDSNAALFDWPGGVT